MYFILFIKKKFKKFGRIKYFSFHLVERTFRGDLIVEKKLLFKKKNNLNFILIIYTLIQIFSQT